MTQWRRRRLWKWEKRGNEKNSPFFQRAYKEVFFFPQTPLWLRHSDWPWVIRSTLLPLSYCALSFFKVVITIAWLWQPNYLWNYSDFMPSYWAGPLSVCVYGDMSNVNPSPEQKNNGFLRCEQSAEWRGALFGVSNSQHLSLISFSVAISPFFLFVQITVLLFFSAPPSFTSSFHLFLSVRVIFDFVFSRENNSSVLMMLWWHHILSV